MLEALRIQTRVIGALTLREARVRHGRTKFGYLWTIVEPCFYVIVLSYLFSAAGRRPPLGDSMAIFFCMGILSYHLFRNLTSQLGSAFDNNQPLFNYPVIEQIDAVYARLILEVATWCFIAMLLMSAIILVVDGSLPDDISQVALSIFLIILMSFGIGLLNAVIRRKYVGWGNMYNIATSPLLFISGIFFTLESIPSEYRWYLAINPLIHGIEGIRVGYYPVYVSTALSLEYLAWWGIITLSLGLVLERLTRAIEQR